MKLKEVTVSYNRKEPIQGVQYSNKEYGETWTYEVSDDDTEQSVRDMIIKKQEDIKIATERGLSEDKPSWLNEPVKPFNKEEIRKQLGRAKKDSF